MSTSVKPFFRILTNFVLQFVEAEPEPVPATEPEPVINECEKLFIYINENDNKVYFITKDDFKFTSIKIYFENEIYYNAILQYQENTII